MNRLVAFKRLEFSADEVMTIDFAQFGRIKAVKVGDQWAFSSRREAPLAARTEIDRVFNDFHSLLYQGSSVLDRCSKCSDFLREDICIACDM